jgi:hypothetical protein
MGREVQCKARSGGKSLHGKALLETNEIIFRGDTLLKIPIMALDSVVARNGELHIKWSGNSAVFELGEQAEKWAHAILYPKNTSEKLGIKPRLRISALHMPDDGVMNDARKLAAEYSEDKPLREADLVFFAAATMSDLTGIKTLAPSLAGNGALWIVYPKGKKDVTELQVLNAGRKAGLVDVKVVSYSASHTALKFVRPKDKR